jgi:hypothetical protein
MAYDWVYPPRDSGEALIHVDWGNDYKLTKPYHLFRQWAEPLKPGMRIVEAVANGRAAAGVKPTAFYGASDHLLVVHVVNVQDRDVPIVLRLTGPFAATTTAARSRTSSKEDALALGELAGTKGTFADTLPARSMVTYRFQSSGK